MYNVTIKRETSAYNKYMLWHVSGVATTTGARFSRHYRTLREAMERHSNNPLYTIVAIIK